MSWWTRVTPSRITAPVLSFLLLLAPPCPPRDGSLHSTHLNKSSPLAPSSPQTPCLHDTPTCGLSLARWPRAGKKKKPPPGATRFCPSSPQVGGNRGPGLPCAFPEPSATSSRLGNPLVPPFFILSLTKRPTLARKQLSSQPAGSGQQGDPDRALCP